MAVFAWFGVASLRHMSICAGVVVAVTLQKIDRAPNAKAGTERDHKGLKDLNSRLKKCHADVWNRNRFIVVLL